MKKVWICLLVGLLFASAFSFAGAAADLTVVDGKAAVDVGAVSIAAGSTAALNINVADLDASEPIKFNVNVLDENGQPIQFALTSLITTVKGENLDLTKSIILVGNYPIADGFSFSTDDGAASWVSVSGTIVAADPTKPVSLNLGFNGVAMTPVEAEAVTAEIAAENLETVAENATFAVKLDEVEIIAPSEKPTEQPTETPTEVPTETPTGTEQPTEVPTTTEQPTETPVSPAPVLGLLAGLAAAGLILRRE